MQPPASAVPRRKFLIIHNPAAGRRSKAELAALVDRLRQAHQAEVAVWETQKRGDAERFARDLAPDRADALVAAGGDGVIGEVINGLIGPDDAPGPWIVAGRPLGIAPMGTANVLAAELETPRETRALAAHLAFAPARNMHVGLADGRAFSMMTGVGLDARVVEHVDRDLKRRIGKGAYVIETLAQLWRGGGARYAADIAGERHEAAAVVVANGRHYGGRYVCAADADVFDPSLRVCLFRRSGRLHALRYLWGVLSGRLAHFPDYAVIAANAVRIEGTVGEAAQGDGDVIGELPLDIRVAPFTVPVLTGRR